MSKNIKSQFMYAIESHFDSGMDKHSAKKQGLSKQNKIYSYSDRRNLIDTSAHISNWLKQKHPDIKFIKDIKSEIIQEYLNENSQGWTKATITVKMSHLRKLEKLVIDSFKGSEICFLSDIIKPCGKNNSRTLSMTRNDFNKLLFTMNKSVSSAKIAIELCGRFGLRVSETTKLQYRDIVIHENGFASINIVDSKGGKSRVIKTSNPSDVLYLDLMKSNRNDKFRVVSINSKSVNKFAQRYLELSGLGKYVKAKTSIHSIRKMVAQEKYDEYRNLGLSRKDSINKVSFFLGHGKNREECISRYVANIW